MVIDRGSVVIGGGEARTAICLYFYCFPFKLKNIGFIFSLIFSTFIYFIAL